MATRPRGAEDSKPKTAPCFFEQAGVRFELPLQVAGVKGLLLVRCNDDGEIEASCRGKAADLMDRIAGRPVQLDDTEDDGA